jgi:pimeloyl-ACP methyl ester carboxylesterase
MISWIFKWMKRLSLGAVAFIIAWCVTGLAMAAGSWGPPPRGVLVDVDGRQQRLVCEGQAQPGVPLVVFESGVYSGSADWGYIQPEVAKGGRTCSYDRAGMGWSQPSPNPRDSATMARELHQLLHAANEPGPYVLVGHSMAGLLTRAFVSQYPDEVVGLILVDAVDPQASSMRTATGWIKRFQTLANVGARVAPFGLVKPLSPFYANRIGLTGLPLQEKRKMFGAASHMAASAREIGAVRDSADVALAGDAFLPALPIATVSAGPAGTPPNLWKDLQARAARLSTRGTSVNVDAANHTSILGPRHGSVVIAAVERVRSDAISDIKIKAMP